MKAARCAFIAGAAATSNVLAGLCYGIPPAGTMAHSYVAAFPREVDAFRAFTHAFPDSITLLLDTYDTVGAARKAVAIGKEMEARGQRLAAVRLDSGDIVALSREVRRILDEADLGYVRIFVSGGLDEHMIEEWLATGAPIDAFGVGTRMDVSADAPYLDMAYKLVKYDGRAVLKTSAGKATLPGEKQVHRFRNGDWFGGDLLALLDEPSPADAQPLLRTVMESGRLARPHPALGAIREHCAGELAALPADARRLRNPGHYSVRCSDRLLALRRSVTARVVATEIAHPREEHPMARREKILEPPRSPKAGRPPQEVVSSPRVRRRQKTAHVAVRKGTTLLEAGHGPRVVQAAKNPKTKKR